MPTSDGRRERHERSRPVDARGPGRFPVMPMTRGLVSAYAALALVVDDARRSGRPLTRDEVLARVESFPTSTRHDDPDDGVEPRVVACSQLGAYMDGRNNRSTEIARRLVAGEMTMGDAVVAQIVSANAEDVRNAATSINRSATAVVVDQAQAALLSNGGRIHEILRTEYDEIMGRTRQIAHLVDGLTDGAEALHAAPDKRAAWIELVDMAERRQAIRDAHNACRGAGIWGRVSASVHPFPSWAFEYPSPDSRPHGYGCLCDELRLVADATVRGARLFNNAESAANADRWAKNLPPEPELVIGEVDLDQRPSRIAG